MNIQMLVSILGLVSSLMPVVTQLVEAVETQFPQAGQGARKAEIVLGAVQELVGQAQGLGASWEQVRPAIVKLVGGIVALKNALGLFKTSAAAKT